MADLCESYSQEYSGYGDKRMNDADLRAQEIVSKSSIIESFTNSKKKYY